MVIDRSVRNVRRARISSLATYVPPRLLTNADLERLVETTDEWILQRTGIRERHIVDAGGATSDLAAEAAREAIRRAGLTPADIDFIVVGTVTPDMMFPSTACLVQAKIGAEHAWGFDLSAACSGFTYALTTAAHSAGATRWASARQLARICPRSTMMTPVALAGTRARSRSPARGGVSIVGEMRAFRSDTSVSELPKGSPVLAPNRAANEASKGPQLLPQRPYGVTW